LSDIGVVNLLARRGKLEPGSELYGKALENWVFHELDAHRHYSELHYSLSYWRLASGLEVDFILGDMNIAIESKATARITTDHLKGLRELARDHPRIRRRVVVCLEERHRRTEDGIDILPAAHFARVLWKDALSPD
jgi:predicted AAA+ superfamily ATPase